MLNVYKEKENEKILKEKKAELEKEKKLKKKILKDKEEKINKSIKEKKNSLMKEKKEILLQIKNNKSKLSNETENRDLFKKNLEDFQRRLKEIETSIILQDMQLLKEKLDIKKEQI